MDHAPSDSLANRPLPLESAARRLGVIAGAAAILPPLLSYRRSARRPRGQVTGQVDRRLRWPKVAAIAALYFGGGRLLWRPLPLRLSRLGRAVACLLGAIFYFPSLGLYFWGYRTLGRQFSVSSSYGAQLYADHELITSGPYAIVRHPMYLAVLTASAGALLMYRTWATAVYALLSGVVAIRARREEAVLAQAFGDAWEDYRQKTPAWLPWPRPAARRSRQCPQQ